MRHETHADFAAALRWLASAAPAAVTSMASDVLKTLRGEKELRVFVDGTRNLGHQSASINLANLLVERSGFAGTLTFVYADYRLRMLGSQQRKLALLGQRRDRRRLGCHVRWIEAGNAETLPPVRFGLTGGADDLSINYARRLNVDWFARLQPYLWDDPPDAAAAPLFVGSRMETRDDRFFYFGDARPDFRQLWTGRAKGAAAARLSRRDRDIARQIIALRRQAYLLWPVYGVQHFDGHGRAIVQTLVQAAEHLARRRGRRVALLSFTPRSAHLPNAGWLEGRANQVSLLHFGPVGAKLYRKVIASSELPPIVEGQESVSQLIDLQRSFLQLRRSDRMKGFEFRDMAGPQPIALDLDEVGRGLAASKADLRNDESGVTDALADFLCRCIDGDAGVADFFASLKPSGGPDKLDFALAALGRLSGMANQN